MAHREPTPPERERAWTTARVMTGLGILVMLFLFVVIVFRGCHNDAIEPEMLDPDVAPLPGTEDVVTRTAVPTPALPLRAQAAAQPRVK